MITNIQIKFCLQMHKIHVFLFINSKLLFWVIHAGLKMASIEASTELAEKGCV